MKPNHGTPPAPPRYGLNSSPLLRQLAHAGATGGAPPKQTLAERLSPWLAWSDAIGLASALTAAAPAAPARSAQAVSVAHRAATDAFERVRGELTLSIGTDVMFATPVDGIEPAAASAAARRRQYHAHQRAMASRIAPLRADVRARLTPLSPELARLAALDEVLEASFAGRERHLLAAVPAWLQQGPDAAPELLRSALLAELDTRLQPVLGLIESMQDDTLRKASTPP